MGRRQRSLPIAILVFLRIQDIRAFEFSILGTEMFMLNLSMDEKTERAALESRVHDERKRRRDGVSCTS